MYIRALIYQIREHARGILAAAVIAALLILAAACVSGREDGLEYAEAVQIGKDGCDTLFTCSVCGEWVTGTELKEHTVSETEQGNEPAYIFMSYIAGGTK